MDSATSPVGPVPQRGAEAAGDAARSSELSESSERIKASEAAGYSKHSKSSAPSEDRRGSQNGSRRVARRTVALLGNPNTGKTTLFNALTGFRSRVGNYPGVTVDKTVGPLRHSPPGTRVEVLDLPGAYSLAANSADEALVLDVLVGSAADRPDVVVVVVDACNLGPNLFLVSQLLDLERPVVVALNMIDLAERHCLQVDAGKLSAELKCPVVPVSARSQEGVDNLRQAILEAIEHPTVHRGPTLPGEVEQALEMLQKTPVLGDGSRSRAELLQVLLDPGGYHEQRLIKRLGSLPTEVEQARANLAGPDESLVEYEARVRYRWIHEVRDRVVRRERPQERSVSERVDRVLTHRFLGLVVLVGLLAACFQSIYAWAGPLMDGIDIAFATVGGSVAEVLPAGALQSLIVDGVVAGVGAVLIFLPQILILFLFIAVLEDCGYMARAAFLLDRWMGLVGLNGKAFIPLLSSFACAIPGILATRTIEHRRDRFITILIAPLMSCSARLPVYVLLIGAFVPSVWLFGGLMSLQALVLLAMYVLGAVVAVFVAIALRMTMFRGEPQPFLLELPSYKWPSIRTVLYRVYEQGKAFVVSAGTIIFAVTIVVWALGYFPRPASIAAEAEAARAEAVAAHEQSVVGAGLDAGADPRADAALASVLEKLDAAAAEVEADLEGEVPPTAEALETRLEAIAVAEGPAGAAALKIWQAEAIRDEALSQIERDEQGAYIRQSWLGRMGRWIEPVVRPLGWDWRIGTAVVASFPAREVVIATMGTIYNLGGDADETSVSLREKLRDARWPDGRPIFNLAVALSLMVFFALCCQCGATLAAIRRETKSWRWPVFTFVYMTSLAYVGALVTYQVVMRLS